MNRTPTIGRPTRSVLVGLCLVAVAALAIGWTAGTVAASSGSRAASPSAVPTAVGATALGAPAVGTTTTLPVSAGGTTTSGTASSIAYPFPGYNSLGVAPQSTILAAGTGTASMKSDGSDKAAALKTATVAALADARAQALAAAAAMGVGLGDIYSLSITSNPSYIYPMPACLVAPPVLGANNGATGSAGGAPASPPVICPQTGSPTPTSVQLVVTVVVAYKYA